MLRSGVDVIEVNRIDHAILRHGDRFFERFYTPQELIDSNGQTPALAARFAAKEAVAKALGTGIGDIAWKEIEVIVGPRREPQLRCMARLISWPPPWASPIGPSASATPSNTRWP